MNINKRIYIFISITKATVKMSKEVVKFKNLDVSKIEFTPLEDNERAKSMKISYIRYKISDSDEIQLKVQTPEIDAEAYGIPQESEYYPDPKKRAFYKFPFCHERKQYDVNYDEIKTFYNKLVEIDEFCNTDDFRKKVFGDKLYNKYAYVPLVRFPEDQGDDEEIRTDKNGNPYYRPPYSKFKIDLEYCTDPDNQTNKPMFALFERKNGKREKIDMASFEDMLDYIKYRNKLRFVISFSKLYAMKTSNGSDKKKYGITLKINCVEVTQNNSIKSKVNNDRDIFDDSDEEDSKTTKTITRQTNKLDIEDDDNDSDEKVNTKQINKASDDEDDDDEDDIVDEPKSKAKPTKQISSKKKEEVSDDDDSEEVVEESKVKSKSKATPTKASAPAKPTRR